MFTTGEDTVKGRSLRRDPRVAICVDDEQPPFAYVIVEGEAEIVDEPDKLLRWATIIGGRYMGADRAEEYGRRNGVPGELLVRVRPLRLIGREGISD